MIWAYWTFYQNNYDNKKQYYETKKRKNERWKLQRCNTFGNKLLSKIAVSMQKKKLPAYSISSTLLICYTLVALGDFVNSQFIPIYYNIILHAHPRHCYNFNNLK